MGNQRIFINRRKRGIERRIDVDRCKNMSLDLFHRKRRKSKERRSPNRTLEQDYVAYQKTQNESVATADQSY